MPKKEQTKRIIRAISNPHVDILFHPTGRIVNRRAPYELDMEAVIIAAKKTKTVMEIDALERLDLKDEHIRMCVDAGVPMAIDSDAHTVAHYAALEFGIMQARRGWATKKDIVNAWPAEQMLKRLK
jgi:DNA polymerase (family 10)